jgi:hypothetical protein
MKAGIACIVFVGWIGILNAQTHSEKLSREFRFEKVTEANTFMVANINGSVRISGYDGDRVVVEVEQTIKAKMEARLEKAKKELSLGIIDRADTIILYVDGLCNTFGRNDRKSFDRKHTGGWGYNWNGCNDDQNWRKDDGFDYKFDFVIRVPAGVNVVASTVNNGDVEILNTRSAVVANNVNGSIRLKNIAGATYANTINGDVDLDYTRNPDKDCRFYTLNGNINANFKKGLGADMSFESFNGSLYTNVARLESQPVALEKKMKDGGVKYKISGNRFKIGDGGVHLDFETFNGNVYLKEN